MLQSASYNLFIFFVVKTRLARIKKNTSIVSEMKAALQDMLPKLVAYGRKCNRRSVKAIVAQIDQIDLKLKMRPQKKVNRIIKKGDIFLLSLYRNYSIKPPLSFKPP